MTGPEHYMAAEKDHAAAVDTTKISTFEGAQLVMASAQIHATLALAAATAAAGGLMKEGPHDVRSAWDRATDGES